MTSDLSLRRAALRTLLVAKLVGGWGLGWDIRWHLFVGRDSFWIPPHVMTYASVTVVALLAFAMLARDTLVARRGAPSAGAIRVLGLTGTPGVQLLWWGIAVTIVAAPIDDLWHRLFGIDVTLWSPPHLLGIAGAQINTTACLVIATECWPRGNGRRRVTLVIAAAFLLGLFEVVVDPGFVTAFQYGGVFFFTVAVLGGACFTFTLVLAARAIDLRSGPLLVAIVAVLVQYSIIAVSDAGFAVFQPVPVIQQAIAEDPTSVIALTHEIGRRTGQPPGRSVAQRVFVAIAAVALVAVDARRRPRAASLAFGAAFIAVSSWGFSRAPALRGLLPHGLEIPFGVGLALLMALAGGAAGVAVASWLSEVSRPGAPSAATEASRTVRASALPAKR
ncbi:MAG: hypothetical protein HY294_08955 [Candidatus Rokubacteria bacterium]|nr:hypothetical protein [Candidatus Rokubacteria bacterium]MBI3826113.1 hypothetical protein [Candidatus Rokubacteria bacterium]